MPAAASRVAVRATSWRWRGHGCGAVAVAVHRASGVAVVAPWPNRDVMCFDVKYVALYVELEIL